MSGLSFDTIAALVPQIKAQYPTSVSLDQWVESMTEPSTSVLECKDVTADERKAILARVPPYDGVRTWSDLVAVRAAQVKTKDTTT